MSKPDPERLAAALRDNLRKRKAQARDAKPVTPAKAGASGREGTDSDQPR